MRMPQTVKKSAHKKKTLPSLKRQKSVGDDTKGGQCDRPFKLMGDLVRADAEWPEAQSGSRVARQSSIFLSACLLFQSV